MNYGFDIAVIHQTVGRQSNFKASLCIPFSKIKVEIFIAVKPSATMNIKKKRFFLVEISMIGENIHLLLVR